MTNFSFRQWTNAPTVTNNFHLVTKLQNFDSFYSKKSILGYILNFTNSNRLDDAVLTLLYRTGENGSWFSLGFLHIRSGNVGVRQFKKIFKLPIKNAVNFQLKIKGRTNGDIALNDITILYRKYRDVSESEL